MPPEAYYLCITKRHNTSHCCSQRDGSGEGFQCDTSSAACGSRNWKGAPSPSRRTGLPWAPRRLRGDRSARSGEQSTLRPALPAGQRAGEVFKKHKIQVMDV
eukprot:TRINITY_DN11369_c0_g1_i1.p2 TRINITY_DN11369_c0_g1~~TRINITY_DN11369_c0_g1_i1.p2  ORF type:complete len:116 (-),score=18.79 TRINITY_DN11369_c0_g1_i1:83-388(-)